jgi:hypothetical protein
MPSLRFLLFLPLLVAFIGCAQTRDGILVNVAGPGDTAKVLKIAKDSAKHFNLRPTPVDLWKRSGVLSAYGRYDSTRLLVEEYLPNILFVRTNPYQENDHEGVLQYKIRLDIEDRLSTNFAPGTLHMKYGYPPAYWVTHGP